MTRTIAFGANTRKFDLDGEKLLKGFYSKNKLYISVGSSCNVCLEDSWKRAAILESDPEGTVTAEFAGGLRNSVFFAFHPETGEMWATEMGRDYLGDNLPPDEINIIKPAEPENKLGARKFGWPFCYGNQITDKTFKPEKIDRTDIPTDCSQTEPATADFITGWLSPSTGSGQAKIYGRPVDLKFGPDGALYISDDTAGIIYKVSY